MKRLDQVRNEIRKKHYSIRTEDAYCGWIRQFILFHDKKHPKDMEEKEISEFISHLAVKRDVASSTQNWESPLSRTAPNSASIFHVFRSREQTGHAV
jgi:hypothetical protein